MWRVERPRQGDPPGQGRRVMKYYRDIETQNVIGVGRGELHHGATMEDVVVLPLADWERLVEARENLGRSYDCVDEDATRDATHELAEVIDAIKKVTP